jgi:uncharacterized protein involved in exopolysaccharide biosynthesis
MSDIIEEKDDDEISLIDLFAIIWQRKVMIIVITLIAALGVATYCVLSLVFPPEKSFLPNKYTPSAHLLINNASSSGGGLSSMLASSGLGGLAGLAGVSLSSGSTFSDLAIYIASTNTMLDTVVDEFGLIERYKLLKSKSPRANSREALKKNLTASYDQKSGVFTIAFTDYNPAFAQSVVNFCVRYLQARFDDLGVDKNMLEKENLEKNIDATFQEIQNLMAESHRLEQSVNRGPAANIPAIMLETTRIQMELTAQQQVYSQLKVQYELLKVTMASEKPVFQIFEMAEVPDKKSGPSRGMLCIIVTFAAGFLSVFLAFLLNAIENIKKDPEAMAKLSPNKKDAAQSAHVSTSLNNHEFPRQK